MKIRDSGMPVEEVWASFFNPKTTLRALELTSACHNVVEFGCGYGTFTVPAARMVSGTVYALDLEPEMISCTQASVDEAGRT
ncbi:MAG: class I SAM-dependent methyltransferase, partial [Planctomycetes bacterium]|nr:class I SAM-dependent methyltransferase [Planctomycetota bacterium]